jgi:hypothetical protein
VNANPLTSGNQTSAATAFTTASISPASNALVLLTVHARPSAMPGSAPAPSVSGCGLTWTLVREQTFTSVGPRMHRTSVFRALGASPSSGQVTITYGSNVLGGWSIAEFSTVDTTTPVVQSNSSTGTSTAPATTLSAFGSASNATYCGIGSVGQDNTATPETNWTEIHDVSQNVTGPYTSLETEWINSNDTSPSATLSQNQTWSCIGLEIAALGLAGTGPGLGGGGWRFGGRPRKHWKGLNMLKLFCLVVCVFLTGCAQARDWISGAIGAPTSSEIRGMAAQIDAKTLEATQLGDQLERLKLEERSAQAKAADFRGRAETIRATASSVAGQLAQAPPGAAYDALAETFGTLQRQLKAALSQADQAAAIAAGYAARASQFDASLARAKVDLEQARSELADVDQRTAAAIANVSGGVKAIGARLSAFGVPGASLVADQISGGAGELLGLILGAGAAGALANRYRRQRNAAREVMETTESYGLQALATDPGARAQARYDLSDAAAGELTRVEALFKGRPQPITSGGGGGGTIDAVPAAGN